MVTDFVDGGNEFFGFLFDLFDKGDIFDLAHNGDFLSFVAESGAANGVFIVFLSHFSGEYTVPFLSVVELPQRLLS